MAIHKGPTEGGSGGKRGHSGMEHYVETEEIKEAARIQRRIDDKQAVDEQREEPDLPAGTNA